MIRIGQRIGALYVTLWFLATERFEAARADERGAMNTVEIAILTTLAAAAAIAVALIIRNKATGTANNIPER